MGVLDTTVEADPVEIKIAADQAWDEGYDAGHADAKIETGYEQGFQDGFGQAYENILAGTELPR
jgi:flagellar biosynthesis/type III secretory pathway protein FliH